MNNENTPAPVDQGDGNLASNVPESRPPSTIERRKPDFDLCVRRKGDTGRWQKIGAGWISQRGGIGIRSDHKLSVDLDEVFACGWGKSRRCSGSRWDRRRRW